jgi:poly-gamma-glutamate capsule biosynthesis protein CapA/YwtB (metallophosphatase superfamily)
VGVVFSSWTYYLIHQNDQILAQQQAKVLFGGDMMFDRSVRTAIEQKGGDFIFSCIDPILKDKDLVVANLEGPITDNASISQGSSPGDSNNFTFTFAPSTAQLLYDHNVRMVNLGNNHIMNFRRDGLVQTKDYLTRAGVRYFGDPDVPDPEKTARIDVHGIPLSFVNWSDWTSDNTDITAAAVRSEHEAGRVVVVYTHWGEEYVPATDRQKRLAHNLVDEGADIVIGSHPHVVQEHEVYKGKNIYYSLGNLIFDQYWMESVTHGLMLEVTFTKTGVSQVKEIPVVLNRDRRTCPEQPQVASSAAAAWILDMLHGMRPATQ